MTVVLPVFNEIHAIDSCLESITGQDYHGRVSIMVADGGSDDGTRARLDEWASRYPGVAIIDNPERLQTHGLNRAAQAASNEILVRVDAHTRYASDYLARSVEALLLSESVAVGGPMVAGTSGSRFQQAVGRAMRSRFGVGPGAFHRSGASGHVDTVYLGAYRRRDFLDIGGYRTFPSGVAEDADLYYRWRQAGRTILLDPAISSTYEPRGTPAALYRQYYRYGRGKADLLWANGMWPSWRPLAPLALVVGLIVGVLLALFSPWLWPLAILGGLWFIVLLAAALPSRWLAPLVGVAVAVMHLSYGVGLLQDLLRGPGPIRKAGLEGIAGATDRGDDANAGESNDLAD